MMVLNITILLTAFILVLFQSYMVTKNPAKAGYIPVGVFIISTIAFSYMLIQANHFIMIDESGFLAKVVQVVIEFLIINSVTLLLYLMTKHHQYKYYFVFFFVVISISAVLFSVNKKNVRYEAYTNDIFMAETIDDEKAILNSIVCCYLEGGCYAGYNSYPLTLKPNIRIIHDVLQLSHMGYYTLSDIDNKTIAIALNEVEPVTFYEEYLYHKSMITLGVTSDFGLERFLNNHYNESSGLFFEDNQDESLMDQLTATLYCIELYNIANIPIPHEDKIKIQLIELLNNDELYVTPENIEDCYEMILAEQGTILRILSLLNKSDDLLDEVYKRKEWFDNITKMVLNNEHNCSQLENWVKNDIFEINNDLYDLNLANEDFIPHNCLSQFMYSDASFESEDFYYDSQYLYDFAKLNYLCGNTINSTEFVTSYIKNSIDTHFRQQYRATVLAQDTFYGVSIANQFNVNFDREKIVNSAFAWVDAFVANTDSNIEINSQAVYGVKILKLLDVSLNIEDFIELQNSILCKLDSSKFIEPDYQKRYLLLHELALLYELKSEINSDNTSDINNDLPEWVVDIMAEDLSTSNLNIAYDLVKLIDINHPSSVEFLNSLEEELEKKTNYIYKVMYRENANEILDEVLRICSIMEMIETPKIEIEEFLDAIDLTSIYIVTRFVKTVF